MQRMPVWVMVALLLGSSAAAAQAPQLTTATYDDWTVRCEMHDAVKTCEIEQTSQIQGQLVSQIALGRPSKSAPFRLSLIHISEPTRRS